jgi:hypothetical protein
MRWGNLGCHLAIGMLLPHAISTNQPLQPHKQSSHSQKSTASSYCKTASRSIGLALSPNVELR